MTTTIPSRARNRPAAQRDVLATLRDALVGLVPAVPTAGTQLVSACVQVDARDPLVWFAAATALGDDAAYWYQPATGSAFVGSGVAASLEVTGSDRFRTAASTW